MQILLYFFFQAEDGIRDLIVTGVQTCALPISSWAAMPLPQSRTSGAPPVSAGGSSTRTGRPTTSASSQPTRSSSAPGSDRKSVGEGKRGDLGGCRIIKKKKKRARESAGVRPTK